MENNFIINDHEEQMELPPGFRFHPRDDELIIHYLYPKVSNASFISQAIGDVDLNKFEPWDLPLRAKFGEKEWYFFCVRDRKYPTGLRTNRATEMGYWKATGKDKEIYKAKTLVGMKKTLVFYKGRAPKGEKTNWVMHEFRLDGKLAIENLPKSTKGEWVISKVFEKTCGEKKNHISGVSDTNYDGYDYEHEVKFDSSNLPPLMDTSNSKNEDLTECFNEPLDFIPSNNDNDIWFPTTRIVQNYEYLQYQEDPSILRFLNNQNNHSNMQQNPKIELDNDQDYPVVLAGAVDLHGLWNC